MNLTVFLGLFGFFVLCGWLGGKLGEVLVQVYFAIEPYVTRKRWIISLVCCLTALVSVTLLH